MDKRLYVELPPFTGRNVPERAVHRRWHIKLLQL